MNLFKREPNVIIGLLVSLLTYIHEEVQTVPGEGLTWKTLFPLVATAIARFFVFSPATVERERFGNTSAT